MRRIRGGEMTESNGLTLAMSRSLPLPPSAVWRAMTDPVELARWWGPRGFSTPHVDFEPRIGHSYRITMQPPEGDPFYLHGEFREVEPLSRLSYTFIWDPPDPDDRETLVVLSLEERGADSRISLTQGEFSTPARLELHEGGWTDGFDRLEELLS
jgi:uncharacterized protein YndB with AHSA1/START domain